MSEKRQITLFESQKRNYPNTQELKKHFIVSIKTAEELYSNLDEQTGVAVLSVDEDFDYHGFCDAIPNMHGIFFCVIAPRELFFRYINMQVFDKVTCVLPDDCDIDTMVAAVNKTIETAKNKSIEKNMNELVEKQMKHALMGEMLSSITHQLRQPINAISAEMIRLKISGFLGEVDSDFLNTLMDNVSIQTQKMSKTISEFLNYFSPATRKEHFMLYELGEEIRLIYKEILNRLGICLETDIPSSIELYGSKSSLIEIIVNFISNAKDAYESGNQLAEKKIIIFKAEDMGHFISISVRDFAGGVAEEHLDKVLSAYFTTKDSEKGTGLGLYISKKIIESEFAGSISAQNSDNGFLVSINIPKINSRITI